MDHNRSLTAAARLSHRPFRPPGFNSSTHQPPRDQHKGQHSLGLLAGRTCKPFAPPGQNGHREASRHCPLLSLNVCCLVSGVFLLWFVACLVLCLFGSGVAWSLGCPFFFLVHLWLASVCVCACCCQGSCKCRGLGPAAWPSNLLFRRGLRLGHVLRQEPQVAHEGTPGLPVDGNPLQDVAVVPLDAQGLLYSKCS